jgi:formyl-CoA transferase
MKPALRSASTHRDHFMHGAAGPHRNEHPIWCPGDLPTRTDNIFIGVGNDGTFRKLAKEIASRSRHRSMLCPQQGPHRQPRRAARRTRRRVQPAQADLCTSAGGWLPAGPVQSTRADQSAYAASRRYSKDWYKGVASRSG